MKEELRLLATAGLRVIQERKQREIEKQREAMRIIEEHRRRVSRTVLSAIPDSLHEFCVVDPIAPGSVNAFLTIDLSSLSGGMIRAKFFLQDDKAVLEGNYVVTTPDGSTKTDDDISVAVALALPDLATELSPAEIG